MESVIPTNDASGDASNDDTNRLLQNLLLNNTDSELRAVFMRVLKACVSASAEDAAATFARSLTSLLVHARTRYPARVDDLASLLRDVVERPTVQTALADIDAVSSLVCVILGKDPAEEHSSGNGEAKEPCPDGAPVDADADADTGVDEDNPEDRDQLGLLPTPIRARPIRPVFGEFDDDIFGGSSAPLLGSVR